MTNSLRSAMAHLASQPKLLALAAVIAVGAHLGAGYTGSTQGQMSGGGNIGGVMGGDVGGGQQPVELRNPVVVDDGDAGFTAASVVVRPTGFLTDNRTVAPNMWSFVASTAGTYDIYATWIAAPANNTATSYVISHRANNITQSLPRVFVNQAVAPDDAVYQNSHWEKVGTLDLATPAAVTVFGATEQSAYIDAFAFVLRTQCSDGIDNDADGAVDFPADFSCSSVADNDESSIRAACQDGIDNDADGRIDFGSAATNDVGCTGLQDNDEYNIPIANITTTKTGPSSVMRGANATYTVSVLNRGPDAAVGLELRDIVPAGLTFVSTNSDLCRHADGVVTCSKPELPSGQIFNVDMVFTLASTLQCGAVIENRAEAETTTSIDNDEDDNISAIVRTTVTCPQCSDALDNDSDGAVDFPADFSCTSATDTDETNAKAQCQDGLDNDGDGKTDAGTAQTNDAGCTGNQDNDELNAIADVRITKAGPSTVARGARVSYTLTATNAGPSAASSIIFSDPVPAGLTFVTGSSSTICSQIGTNIVCNRSEALDSGQSASVTIAFSVPTTFTCNGTIQNQASVSTATTDPNPSNNQSQTVSTTVNCPLSADLSITKSGPTSVTRSGSISYTLTASNAGPNAASGAITDTIPEGLTFRPTLSTSTCRQFGNSIYCPTALLLSGQSSSVTLVFNVPNTYTCNGTIQNLATITSSVSDPNLTNNASAAVSTTVTCPVTADLSITKSGLSTVVRGGRVSYTLTVMNAGPNAASSITIQDPIPAGLTFASGSSSTICAQNGTNILCNRSEQLASGQSTSVTIAFNVPTTFACNGTIQNQASVSTATSDPNPPNNQSQTVSTTVTCPVASSSASSSSTSSSVAGPAQGNLLVFMVGENRSQVLAGTLSDPVFGFTMQATGTESIRVRRIALRTHSVINLASIDRVELYDGAVLKATLMPNGCGDTLLSTVCSDLAIPIVLQPQQSLYLRAKVLIKPDTLVQSSGEVVQFRIQHVAGKQEFIAEGVTTGRLLVSNNGNSIPEGEIFYGRSLPNGPDTVHAGVVSQIVHAKLASLTNANPDTDNTAVPTGIAPVGQFRFTAATNVNSQNGINQFVVRGIRFAVDSSNVAMQREGFKIYNKQDSTQKLNCNGSNAITTMAGVPITTSTVQGSFFVNCNTEALAGLSEVRSGENQTFVLEANISNPKVSNALVSRLTVFLSNPSAVTSTLTPPTLGLGNTTVQWSDRDSVLNRPFGWIDRQTVFSTRYRTN